MASGIFFETSRPPLTHAILTHYCTKNDGPQPQEAAAFPWFLMSQYNMFVRSSPLNFHG